MKLKIAKNLKSKKLLFAKNSTTKQYCKFINKKKINLNPK